MEALLLLAAFTAINLAAFVLLDLLTGPAPWRCKAGWAALVIGLPLLGPLLCYWRAPAVAPGRGRRRASPEPASGPDRQAADAAAEPAPWHRDQEHFP